MSKHTDLSPTSRGTLRISDHVETEAQWAALLSDRYEWMIRHARFQLGDSQEDAEDLVACIQQEILEGKFNRILPAEDCEAIRFTIGVIRLKAGRVLRRRLKWTSIDSVEAYLIAPGRDPAEDAEFAEIRQRVSWAIDQLPTRQRELALAHWVEGISVPAAAERFGISPKTAKELLRRARKRLRNLLETRC